MTAVSHIADTLRAVGLRLDVAPGCALTVAPRSRITDELRALIRAHKGVLVEWLGPRTGLIPTRSPREILIAGAGHTALP